MSSIARDRIFLFLRLRYFGARFLRTTYQFTAYTTYANEEKLCRMIPHISPHIVRNRIFDFHQETLLGRASGIPQIDPQPTFPISNLRMVAHIRPHHRSTSDISISHRRRCWARLLTSLNGFTAYGWYPIELKLGWMISHINRQNDSDLNSSIFPRRRCEGTLLEICKSIHSLQDSLD